MQKEQYTVQIANMATALLSQSDGFMDSHHGHKNQRIREAVELAASIFLEANKQADAEFSGDDGVVFTEKTF